ncbi:hypothetical protein AVEN_75473-1 [Araneus ventricosus]|uniref:Uncharacterized protein n=1 Tax=Araneus ventricosus TaxID=182803 RepID=A0A4Y2KM55_ARAVE|nr:hypothetical protein AVEN_75473-1 [Araneus ventricosus]
MFQNFFLSSKQDIIRRDVSGFALSPQKQDIIEERCFPEWFYYPDETGHYEEMFQNVLPILKKQDIERDLRMVVPQEPGREENVSEWFALSSRTRIL